jgi:CspA family cold shock protein
MYKGQVKWFNSKQGFGFIVGPNNEDIFVHYKYIEMDGYKTLNKNQLVEYDIEKTDKGPQARSVKPIKFEN